MIRRAAASAVVVVAAAAGVAGCESTQAKSARLKSASVNRPAEKGLTIAQESRDVRIGETLLLQDELGAAVVVELRNPGRKPQVRVPVAFAVATRGGEKLFANDAPGLDVSLVEASVVPPRGRLLWVNDQVRLSGEGKVSARAGASLEPAPAEMPRIEVEGEPKIEADPSGGFVAIGKVRNESAVEQRRLVVFATAARDGRVVAAGRSIVPRLKPGATARFTAFLVGRPEDAELSVAVPPSTLR